MRQSSQPLPHSALKQLARFVGTWHVSGPAITGEVIFKWLEGGFFLVQHVDLAYEGRAIKGVEYIGYDEASSVCTSHFFDNTGHIFTYVWEVEDDEITIWFGAKDSNNRFKGRFSDDGDAYSGAWAWPGGGYSTTLTRVR
jgi:hypothetical protein